MKSIALFLLTLASSSAYTLHEWGTFTTVAGSDGILLSGLEREEAPLPAFTYSHHGMENGNLQRPLPVADLLNPFLLTKGIRRPVTGVTVKMETPVIYFHSDRAFDVEVKVGFKGGTISQWYPQRSGGEVLPAPPQPKESPVNWTLDFTRPRVGSIEWQARVLSPRESRDAILFKPGESLHWMRPRVPEANAVRTADGESEGFLFYRGIGAFDPGLVTTIGNDDTLQLRNRTGGAIPFALVFERTGHHCRWKNLADALGKDATVDLPLDQFTEGDVNFAEPVYRGMIDGLTATGLLRSEAVAMVETWWDSYFAAEGLRVFWVMPRAQTDDILPLEVTPPPADSVRIMVGRSEVLRPARERAWLGLATSTDPVEQSRWEQIKKSDRFGLAYQRRLDALTATAARE
ncbi:hypothetical protein [Luteolibacter marinus]|uniref:hypothetical protein n=1 Tax=Luteolibacter marinus TaxID=2776705 RepID=UPI0018669A63|nr:hypothetical protein [Luteolibacter marinus]